MKSAAKWDESHLLRDYSRPPPWLLFRVGIWLLGLLRQALQWLAPAPLVIFDLNMGTWRTQVLYTVTSLGVADILAAGPRTAEQIAESLDGNAKELYRVMRAAVQLGLFSVARGCSAQGRPRFQNNKFSAMLRGDHPNCLKHVVVDMMDLSKQAWDAQPWRVLTGGKCFEKTHDGTPFFEWLQAHPKVEHGFSRAMGEIETLGSRAITVDHNWNSFSRIIDVGGAYGSFLEALLLANEKPSGVLFDQEQVIERAAQLWKTDERKSSLADRVELYGGDFFDVAKIPAGRDGDAYVLRLIMHDWNDANCVAILTNLRRAMGGARATLIIAETCIRREFHDPVFQRGVLDLHMQAVMDGAERNVQQWKELFAQSGFVFNRLIETRGVFSLVEALPQALPASTQ